MSRTLWYILQMVFLFAFTKPVCSQPIIETINQSNDHLVIFNCHNSIAMTDTITWNFGDDCNFSPAYIPSDCDFKTVGKNQVEHIYNRDGNFTVSAKIKGNLYFTSIQISSKTESVSKRTTTIQRNGSFEIFTNLPYKISQLNYAVPWESASKATPDYFHTYSKPSQVSDWSVQIPNNFAGYSNPATGLAYAGFLTYYQPDTSLAIGQNSDTNSRNYREYISQELNDTLTTGVQYTIQFKIKLSTKSRVKTPVGFLLGSRW